ncbi:MAG TPA: MFS transporter [Candidatus Dormibacteraeota bacterium]|jgi:DHA1 family inner membrane transport protein
MTPAARRLALIHVSSVYFLTAASEALISPLFPLVRHDLHLDVSQQAVLLAALTVSIAVCNVVGGVLGFRGSDGRVVRLAALLLGAGALISGLAPSFAILLLGQAILGAGSGLFFASGLATVGRMYPVRRGRAVANYGLAYSLALATAAFAGNVGQGHWRLPFIAAGVAAAALAVLAPRYLEADHQPGIPGQMMASLRAGLRSPLYRVALLTGVVAGTTNYVIIGLSPTMFVDRGETLPYVATLMGIGRLAATVGKFSGGRLYDRFGGLLTSMVVMLTLVVVGAAMLLAPAAVGAVLVIPFVTVAAILFTVSNTLSVSALPSRSSFTIGVYRAVLVGSSAVVSAGVGALVHTVSLQHVIVLTLAVPLAGGVAVAMTLRRTGRLAASSDLLPAAPAGETASLSL